MSRQPDECEPAVGNSGGENESSRLYTPSEVAQILRVPESWLRRKASSRSIPCTFLGKHLRFSNRDLETIVHEGSRSAHRR
ncbi:helix-turn-helix domain-containing protein [Saccharopolyspora sp. NPDC049426]|uniref:helix-turn-helix domain-containing protein n=1 Tax=Saccharopolyspora sp. NPDC049426 TaxID=3155652 RepID=UPI00343716E9